MKLSLSWIFDHLEIDWKDCDIQQLIAKFNVTTAEVERYYKVAVDLSTLSAATVVEKTDIAVVVNSTEWNKKFSLPHRPDAKVGDVFLITRTGWATIADLKGEKEGLMPAITLEDKELDGSWKDTFETEDWIIEIDNKSVTHRPDMWGHRGFAREIAAILSVKLKPIQSLLETHAIKKYEDAVPATKANPFAIQVKNHTICKYFAGLYISEVANEASLLSMAHRLLRVDARSINAIVDATNYVMLDIGQPMHAFDAAKISSKKIEPKFASAKEKLVILDGQTIELTSHDIVISDGAKPLALAGIMGGKETGITLDSNEIFLEAACFDAATIRKTSARLKLRTEASARFEKSLDPHQTVIALQRFLKLMHQAGITMKVSDSIAVIGKESPAKTIDISHAFIESRLGTSIKPEEVRSILEKIECTVDEQRRADTIMYKVTVPSFRSTKDLLIKEDLVEEVGRFHGYDTIAAVLPSFAHMPSDLNPMQTLRQIKEHLAYAMHVHEVCNYAFYDEEFMQRLGWRASGSATLLNPVSEHWKTLVTSLVPHLLKNVEQNQAKHEHLRFFEQGRIWFAKADKTIQEKKSITGIMSDRKKSVDFYQVKAMLVSFFEMLDIKVSWTKALSSDEPWYSEYQTAYLKHGEKVIGKAGKAHQLFINKVIEGDAFIFELDADYLVSYKQSVHTYKPIPKYPEVWLDISMLVPVTIAVDNVIEVISHADSRIRRVELIDFFEKEEWAGKRSLTFRYYAVDADKTMDKEEIDSIMRKVNGAVQSLGVTIR